MFAPPPELTAEVFARLPDSFRVRGRSSRWADEQRGGAATHSFLEGPSFDTAGRLFVVDIPWGRIFTISPQGEFELLTEYDGEPNGLKIHRDGRIFVANYRRGRMVVDPHSRRVEPFLDAAIRSTFRGLNDLHFALNGACTSSIKASRDCTTPLVACTASGRTGRSTCFWTTYPAPTARH